MFTRFQSKPNFNFAGALLKADIACDGWEPFKDEKCFQVMPGGQQTYDAAKGICTEHNATLATIKSAEEQGFITKLLFESHKIVDEVWIGAHKDGKVFKWDLDSSEVTYTNWADKDPSNLANEDCVQLLPKPSAQGSIILGNGNNTHLRADRGDSMGRFHLKDDITDKLPQIDSKNFLG